MSENEEVKQQLSNEAAASASLQQLKVVLTPPVSLDDKFMAGHRPPNFLQRVLSTLANLRPGADLTQFKVSHHPPVTALHATDTESKVDLTWCHNVNPKFHGTTVEITVKGKRYLKLLSFGETYEMDAPGLLVKIIPPRRADWYGNVRIQCNETDLAADLKYYVKNQSYLSFSGSAQRAVKGKIFHISNPEEILYEISGDWDKTVTLKNVQSGEATVLYDANQAISILNTPVLKDPKNLWPTESAAVWSEVSEGILTGDWSKATRGKSDVEETQRRLTKERKAEGKVWTPNHFSVAQTQNGSWECKPLEQLVPPAPIVVPQ